MSHDHDHFFENFKIRIDIQFSISLTAQGVGAFRIYSETMTLNKQYHLKVTDKNKKRDIGAMSMGTILLALGLLTLLAVLLGFCCRRRRHQGQVLSPPPPVPPAPNVAPVPYPQQQYAPAPYPVVTTYPTQAAAPYPAPAPYPHAGPAMPLPAAGYPPYSAVAPYPAAPFPQPYPEHYPSAPSAPEANALPPSYEQATGTKHPPYPH